MSAANRQYILNDKHQIVAADENGVAQSDTPIDNNATIHLPTPPPQQADQPNVYFTNSSKNNAFNASGAAFFSDKQPTYETYEAYLKAQSSAQAAHNHAQQQQQQQQQQQHHHQQQQQQQHHHAQQQHHHHQQQQQHHHQQQRQHPTPQPQRQHHTPAPAPPAPAPQSKGGCTACKDCPNKVLPATITFVNYVPETPIYPDSQLKEDNNSNLLKHYYYAQPPALHTAAAPPAPAAHQAAPQPAPQQHHQQPQQQAAPPAQAAAPRAIRTKQIATAAPPPPAAAAPAQHAPAPAHHAAHHAPAHHAPAAQGQPQQVYYYPIPHPPAQKHHQAPAPQAAPAPPAPKPCTACNQAQQKPAAAPAPQAKNAAPIYYAHHKPLPYYSTLPSSVSKQATHLSHYVPAPIVPPAHIQAQPAHQPSKQHIIRQKSSGNLLRHQPTSYAASSGADKTAHHHYKPADPSPAPKSNCTACKHSAQPPSRASGSLNRAETVGCLPCMQKKLQIEAQIRAQIAAQEAADLQAKIRSLQTASNQVKVTATQKA